MVLRDFAFISLKIVGVLQLLLSRDYFFYLKANKVNIILFNEILFIVSYINDKIFTRINHSM